MNILKRTIYHITTIILISISLHQSLLAQVDPDDPFRGNYLLGQNSEIVTLSGLNGNSMFTFLDSDGDITGGGLVELSKQYVEAPGGVFGTSRQVDLVTGDFNTDGYSDLAAIWPGPDSTVTLFMPDINPETFEFTSSTSLTIQDDGFPKLYTIDQYNLHGWIRMVSGQFDDDTEPEIVVAYWADDGSPDGGPIQIILYDTDGTLAARPSASINNRRLYPSIENAGGNLRDGSRFDIAVGDLDGDGTDEIVLMSVEPGQASSSGRLGWQLVATAYDVVDGEIVETASNNLFGQPGNFNQYVERLAVTTGDFDGDFKDEIAVGWEEGVTNEAAFRIEVLTLDITPGLDAISLVSSKNFRSGRGQSGWPMSIIGDDVNQDGKDEIIHFSKSDLRIYEPDENLTIGSEVEFATLITFETQQHHRTVALTDVDISDSDFLRMEVITLDNSGVTVWQNSAGGDGFDIGGNGGDYTAQFPASGFSMATGDFDGDAVQLGPPSRQTVTDITQPLVVLNAPPIHFDIINGVTYDINKCYDADFRINCEHRSIYENANSTEMEVSTQVNSDWGVSQSIEAEAGADFGFIEASVKGSLGRKYGEGFSNVEGSTQTVTVKVTSDAIEDDRIYATVSNYDILEYPVYAQNTRQGSVIAVVPKLTGVESLQNTWMGSKSGNARDYISDHEVGNILSYRSEPKLPPGAVFFGDGNLEGGGGDTWELSGNATQTWELRFSSQSISQREQSAYQQVSRSAETTVSGGYGPFRASLTAKVSDEYNNEQISTHRTTVREESALMVEFGTIDATILGSKTYTVSPYVYWASNGALVLDYAVNPDVSAGVPSWWEEMYGANPDLTMNLPWKFDEQKSIGSTNPEVQKEETRDIIFNPLRPEAGEEVTISARIQNYSLADIFSPISVRFYLGDPRIDGELLADENGNSIIEIQQIRSRESEVAELRGWMMPEGLNGDSKIYVVIDEGDEVPEVHETNNIAWALVNPELGTATSAEEEISETPLQHRLHQNYPNPFNPSTTIGFDLGESSRVALDIFDVTGRKVAELVDGPMAKGYHTVRFDGSALSSGVYFYRLSTSGFVQTRQLVLVK